MSADGIFFLVAFAASQLVDFVMRRRLRGLNDEIVTLKDRRIESLEATIALRKESIESQTRTIALLGGRSLRQVYGRDVRREAN